MVEMLEQMWEELTNDRVFRSWPEAGWDPVYGIMKKGGFYDNTPLYDYLKSILGEKDIKKRIVVSSGDANSGAYIHMLPYDMDQSDKDQIISSVVGSASIPFFFPPRNMS